MNLITLKVVLVGDGAVGKTSLLKRLKTEPRTPATVSNEYRVSHIKDGNTIDIHFWESHGQCDTDKFHVLMYPATDVFLLCFSMDSAVSYENIKNTWYPEVIHHEPAAHRILVGMKSDLCQHEYNGPPRESHGRGDEMLVFGYVHRLDLDVLDEIINIILDFKRDEYPPNYTRFAPKHEIERTVTECGYDGYIEVSALNGRNMDPLLSLITGVAIRHEEPQRNKCRLL